MKFPPMLVVARSRAVVGALALSLWAVSCAAPKSGGAGDRAVFDLSETQRRSRFPKVQNIGVVELSAARIAVRPHGKAKDEQAYAASGGAYLVKKVDSPILATAPEILVTPDSAILKGPQARVLKNGQVYIAETVDSVITIDGTQVNVSGPHRIESLETWKKQPVLVAPPAPPAPAPAVIQASAQPVAATASRTKKTPEVKAAATPAVVAEKEKNVPVKPAPQPVKTVAAPVVKKAPAKPVVASKPAQKPAPAPKPAARPVEKVDRKELLNLMRAPSD
ncbi:MAG TPA: hypothetical protein VGE29_22340 [Prosthecobacter sp.]